MTLANHSTSAFFLELCSEKSIISNKLDFIFNMFEVIKNCIYHIYLCDNRIEIF